MVISYIKTYLDSLEKALEINRKNLNIPEEMAIEKVFVKEHSYEERIKNKDKDGEQIPFILLRPLNGEQKYENGRHKKTQKYLIRIAVKEENLEAGYSNSSHLADRIISFFTHNPLAKQKENGYNYHINLGSIKNELNLDLTGGDYWVWDILIDLDVPVL